MSNLYTLDVETLCATEQHCIADPETNTEHEAETEGAMKLEHEAARTPDEAEGAIETYDTDWSASQIASTQDLKCEPDDLSPSGALSVCVTCPLARRSADELSICVTAERTQFFYTNEHDLDAAGDVTTATGDCHSQKSNRILSEWSDHAFNPPSNQAACN